MSQRCCGRIAIVVIDVEVVSVAEIEISKRVAIIGLGILWSERMS